MGIFDLLKKGNRVEYKTSTDNFLDDVTFIGEMKHIDITPWHRYNVVLSARGYGWSDMIKWADYMVDADLEDISQVTIGSVGTQENNVTESYLENGCKCSKTPELNTEMGMLSIAGMSKTLKVPMKIVWINQTKTLQFFTLVNDEMLVKKYIETVVRRSFGTENAMKLGKPLTKKRKFDLKKIVGYFLMLFSTICLIGGLINKSDDYTALGVTIGVNVIGGILVFWEKILLILKPWVDSLVLKIQNSIVLDRMFRISTVICGISLACVLIFGPLGIEVPAMFFVAAALITMPMFFGSIYMGCGFFTDKRTIVWLKGQAIYISSKKFLEWKKKYPYQKTFEMCGAVQLKGKDPVISLYEDNIKTREYCLQTEGDEDFNKKYFVFSVRLSLIGNPAVPIAQIDGFISDTPKNREMTLENIGYRMEGHYLACGKEISKQRYESIRGQDLVAKGLKYHGYTTPANIRLIGICPECGKSFTFHGYAFYMAQSDVAYSDDGMDCCEIQAYDINKDTWVYETDGKTFRYYNSFNCPHCNTPYIDYKKHPKNKVFGVSGCVHLGRKPYKAE